MEIHHNTIQKAKAAQLRISSWRAANTMSPWSCTISQFGGYDQKEIGILAREHYRLGFHWTSRNQSNGVFTGSKQVMSTVIIVRVDQANTPRPAAAIIEEGKATIVESHILGCGIALPCPTTVSFVKAWAINSEVGVFYTDISAGSLSIKEDSVIGPVKKQQFNCRGCETNGFDRFNPELIRPSKSRKAGPIKAESTTISGRFRRRSQTRQSGQAVLCGSCR